MMTRINKVLIQLWLPAVLIAAWWFLTAEGTSLNFPFLGDIATATGELWFWEHTLSDLLPSLRNMLSGLLIASALGVSLGLVLGSMPRLLAAVEPMLDFFRALPAVAILPVMILILGLGDQMRVTVIVLGAIWPVLINTTQAVRGIDPTVKDMQAAFDVSTTSRYLRVRLGMALPQILSGIRTALYIAVALIVVSEMQGAGEGIGRFVLSAQRNWAITDMWSGMIILGVLGYLLAVGFRILERYLLRNYPPVRTGKDH
jgi:ABC-type nitrate/sulfonate/bicarbonate transport system permease component